MKRQLGQRKTITDRFSLNLDIESAFKGLSAALEVEVEETGREFILDNATKQHLLLVAEWITNPKAKPGLLLMGSYGNGKTTMLKAISRFTEFFLIRTLPADKWIRFPLRRARDISDLFLEDDFKKPFDSLCREQLLAVDDLGEEPYEVVRFGMNFHPLLDLLMERYDGRRFTVLSTNLTHDELGRQYGARMRDRFREMMHVINFDNPSYRL